MPNLRAEDVSYGVIADERVRAHLDREAQYRSATAFHVHCSKLGIHDLGEVNPDQLFALVASRNVGSAIDLLRIPKGNPRSQDGPPKSYDIHRAKTSFGPGVHAFLGSSPETDQEWAILRDPEDIPEAVPEDLLLRRLAPKEFLRRLAEGELVREAWIQDEIDVDADITTSALEEAAASKNSQDEAGETIPVSYLLLDASESMDTKKDFRNQVARGIALAFVLSQYEAGNPVYVCLFRHELSPLYGGSDRTGFEEAVSVVLEHPCSGMTYLQGALRLLSGIVKRQSTRIDIALVTDGISRLHENPLEGTHLHTFLLGVRPEEFDKVMVTQYSEASETLASWSDFFLRFPAEVMSRAAVPTLEDVLDAGQTLYGIEDEVATAASIEKIKRLRNRVQNVRLMAERFRNANSVSVPAIEDLLVQLKELTERVGKIDTNEQIQRNSRDWSVIDRDMNVAIEMRQLKSLLSNEPIHATVEMRHVDTSVPMFQALRLVWKQLRSFLRRVLKKIVRMARR